MGSRHLLAAVRPRSAPARAALALLAALTLGACGSSPGAATEAAAGAGLDAAAPAASAAGTGGHDHTAGAAGSGHTGEAGDPAGVAAGAGGHDHAAGGHDHGSVSIPDYPTGLVPDSLRIPAIGVDARTVPLSLAGQEPEVPSDFSLTGWYEETRRPGEIGPAVLAGHIDSVDRPAVFARLDELAPGDEIVVADAEGSSVTFVVTGSGRYPKGDLPEEVLGFGQPVPELRLITCGGAFDDATGHYRDNFVVFAELSGT